MSIIRTGDGFRRAARLALMLPRDSRCVARIDPSLTWDWRDFYAMLTSYSLRQLVWSKTKDAQKKHPTNAPEMIGPEFILAKLRHAEKSKGKIGSRKWTPNARTFKTSAELDEYLRKPRKSTSK